MKSTLKGKHIGSVDNVQKDAQDWSCQAKEDMKAVREEDTEDRVW